MRHGLLIAVWLTACDTPSETSQAPAEAPATEATSRDESPAGVAAVAAKIRAEPGRQAAILEDHGWTAESFEAALWTIADDAEQSEAYAGAMP